MSAHSLYEFVFLHREHTHVKRYALIGCDTRKLIRHLYLTLPGVKQTVIYIMSAYSIS